MSDLIVLRIDSADTSLVNSNCDFKVNSIINGKSRAAILKKLFRVYTCVVVAGQLRLMKPILNSLIGLAF